MADLPALKARHATQIDEFEAWAAAGDWRVFHREHYDWWAFPIDRPSSQGPRWVVSPDEAAELRGDPAFWTRYERGLKLVAASFGWDLGRASRITAPQPGQGWHDWPVRLHKMARSARLFGADRAFESLRALALELYPGGQGMSYGGHDLGWIFRGDPDPYPGER
jgi:hypothetical protein